MIAFAFALAVQAPQSPVVVMPAIDPSICKAGHDLAAEIQAGLPKMDGADTRLDGFWVTCGARRFEWDKTVMRDLTSDPQAWKDREAALWSDVACKSARLGPVARNGWHLVQRLTFLNGKTIVLEASCR